MVGPSPQHVHSPRRDSAFSWRLTASISQALAALAMLYLASAEGAPINDEIVPEQAPLSSLIL